MKYPYYPLLYLDSENSMLYKLYFFAGMTSYISYRPPKKEKSFLQGEVYPRRDLALGSRHSATFSQEFVARSCAVVNFERRRMVLAFGF